MFKYSCAYFSSIQRSQKSKKNYHDFKRQWALLNYLNYYRASQNFFNSISILKEDRATPRNLRAFESGNHCPPYHFWRYKYGEPRESADYPGGVVDALKTTLCFIDPRSISWLQRTRSPDKIVAEWYCHACIGKTTSGTLALIPNILDARVIKISSHHAFREIPI